MATKNEKNHMEKVASLGCLICHMPAQVHHCFTRIGGGRNHFKTIPLCHIHHTNGGHGIALHAGKKAFEIIHGTEQELLNKTNQLLNNL